MDNPRPCGPQPFANSNSGNGNLRPETLGAPRREKFSQRAKPTAETGSPRAGYGNVALFLTLGNHVGLRGLPGGARSLAKPVCGGRRGKSEVFTARGFSGSSEDIVVFGPRKWLWTSRLWLVNEPFQCVSTDAKRAESRFQPEKLAEKPPRSFREVS